MNKHSGDLESYIIISRFIKILQTLPASESAAERIFARMHDIINEKQTRLSEKSLRSQIILSFYVDQIKKEKIEYTFINTYLFIFCYVVKRFQRSYVVKAFIVLLQD